MSSANCQQTDCTLCFYCKVTLSSRHEHDHFPTPVRAGGTSTVSTCLNCHDFKDRIQLNYWPADLLMQAMDEAGPMGRVLIAKCAALVANHSADRAAA